MECDTVAYGDKYRLYPNPCAHYSAYYFALVDQAQQAAIWHIQLWDGREGHPDVRLFLTVGDGPVLVHRK